MSEPLFEIAPRELPEGDVEFRQALRHEVSWLLFERHYLGPITRDRYVYGGFVGDVCVAAMVWTLPTSRFLPNDGSWLELARWCLTPAAGRYAGSRMSAACVRWLRGRDQRVTTLVSYSDPSVGHTGALYRACNWRWAPTWHRLRPPPSGNGDWGSGRQSVKDRWVYDVGPDPLRSEYLRVKDDALVRSLESEEAK